MRLIFCEFSLQLDATAFNLSGFNDSLLKHNAFLETTLIELVPKTKLGKKLIRNPVYETIYACDCDLITSDSLFIDTMDTYNRFYFYERFNNAEASEGIYRFIKLSGKKDLLLVRPYTLTAAIYAVWKAFVRNGSDLGWYSVKRPSVEYTSEEVRKQFWQEFLKD
jgi:hypothetical protein